VDPKIDSYSAFYDNLHMRDTGLAAALRDRGVSEIWLVGLATDYCVLYTARDGRKLGFEVVVVQDGVRAVDLNPGDGERALESMAAAGCRIASRGRRL
jgi:nicotinamidase/pyrazinamidase